MRIALQLLVFLFVTLSIIPATPAEMNARDVMLAQKERHKSNSESVLQRMTLIDKSGRKELRTAQSHTKEVETDLNRTMIVFLKPADVRGTALLTWQHADRPDDQWLYFPARGKMKRIAKGGKRNYFLGTDFTYEDMEKEEIDDYHYQILREEDLAGRQCYVISAEPINEEKKRTSGYSKRVLWIAKEHLLSLKVEFYNRRGKLIKTQTISKWEPVAGTIWRPAQMLMDNHKNQHQTMIEILEREVNHEIDDQIFTKRWILKGRHLR